MHQVEQQARGRDDCWRMLMPCNPDQSRIELAYLLSLHAPEEFGLISPLWQGLACFVSFLHLVKLRQELAGKHPCGDALHWNLTEDPKRDRCDNTETPNSDSEGL